MTVRCQFLGVAGYKFITSAGKHVVIDPFLRDTLTVESLNRVDLLLITHNAFDHLGDSAEVIRTYGCPVICAKDVMFNLVKYHGIASDLFRPTIWSVSMTVAEVRVRPVPSIHWSFAESPDGSQLLSGPAMGFILDAGPDVRIYHQGDSALTYDMKLWGELYKPTVGLLLCTIPQGPGVSLPHMECYSTAETTPYEAFLTAKWLGLKHVVLSHYTDPENSDNLELLKLFEAADQKDGTAPSVQAPKTGEWLEF